jgi:hypothetical protein
MTQNPGASEAIARGFDSSSTYFLPMYTVMVVFSAIFKEETYEWKRRTGSSNSSNYESGCDATEATGASRRDVG